MKPPTFNERVSDRLERISPAERRVVRFFQDHRAETLIAPASAIAEQTGTSDATVVRAAKSMGFSGMEALRRALADEMRENPTPANRMAHTLDAAGGDIMAAFNGTIDIHQQALDRLRSDMTPQILKSTLKYIVRAKRVFLFGIGPSSAMAEYFSTQLCRFGIEAVPLTRTGLLLADQLLGLRKGDVMMIFAYGRLYVELEAIIDQATRLAIPKLLFTDSLGAPLRDRVDVVLPVQRGRADMLSMHTATLGLIEALLVGVAMERPKKTMASLDALNGLRAKLAGKGAGKKMNLPTP